MKIETRLLNGKRVGYFANNAGLGSDATVQEAIDYGYVVGKRELIAANAAGVLKSMAKGVQKDGNGRKVDGIITLNAFPSCRLPDITDEVTKDIIKVNLRARTLKDVKVDTSAWSFVIEGSTGTLVVTVITTGEEDNVVKIGEAVIINGLELAMADGDTLTWKVSETGTEGTIAAEHLTSAPTRITVAAAALEELAEDPENAGRTLVFTGKIGGKKFIKSATIAL